MSIDRDKPLNLLYAGEAAQWPAYAEHLPKALAARGLTARLAPDHAPDFTPAEVDYIIYAPSGPLRDFSPYRRARAVLSLWAGVERVVGNATLTQPLCRMVDEGLEQGMVEYVAGHVLRLHLGLDRFLGATPHWDQRYPPLARNRRVTILGLGALGAASAQALKALGFNVSGWSQSAKQLDGITCHHGPEGLRAALSTAEILVTLLPNTPQTTNLLHAETLALLPRGAHVINPGRGTLIDDEALLAALDTGQIGSATLDVFRIEPLPADHPYWAHPKVTVTPHVAAETRPETASAVIAENIARIETGQAPLYLVDRAKGY